MVSWSYRRWRSCSTPRLRSWVPATRRAGTRSASTCETLRPNQARFSYRERKLQKCLASASRLSSGLKSAASYPSPNASASEQCGIGSMMSSRLPEATAYLFTLHPSSSERISAGYRTLHVQGLLCRSANSGCVSTYAGKRSTGIARLSSPLLTPRRRDLSIRQQCLKLRIELATQHGTALVTLE